MIRQKQHLEDVAWLVGHRDAVGVDGLDAVLGLPVGEAVEELENARRVRRELVGFALVEYGLVL